MGQSESRSLARITREDLGLSEKNGRGGGERNTIQVLGKRDLDEGAHRPVYGRRRSGLNTSRSGAGASPCRAPVSARPVDAEHEKSVGEITVIDLLNQEEKEHRPLQGSCCCCHSAQLNGNILQQNANISGHRSQMQLEASQDLHFDESNAAKMRQTRQSWLLEELNFIARRSSKQTASDRKTVARTARRARVDQDGRPSWCAGAGGNRDDSGPSRQDRKGFTEIDANVRRAQTDDIKSVPQVSLPISRSHKRREHATTISNNGTKSRAATFVNAKQSEPLKPAPVRAQESPVNDLLVMNESESARDKSEILTTQAGLADAVPVEPLGSSPARTCECNGTVDVVGSTAATNLAAVNNAIETGQSDDHQTAALGCRSDSSKAHDGNSIAAAGTAGTEVATCADSAGEISGAVVSESRLMSVARQAAGKVHASNETDQELESSKPVEPSGDPASGGSEQQNAATASEENSAKLSNENAQTTSSIQEEKQQQQQQQNQHQQVASEKSKSANVLEEPNYAIYTREASRRLAWNELATKYGRMTRKGQWLVPQTPPGASSGEVTSPPIARSRTSRLRDSCFCHIACALLQTIFPIFGAFKDYSLPGDLFADLAAGFTVAILHIPQGMAYGLLSGVEPIHGLYVSFIPVLIMSVMSKSRHASYGTFAIISMLLVDTIQQVRVAWREEQSRMFGPAGLQANSSGSVLIITDNHRPAQDLPRHEQTQDLLLKNLIDQSVSGQINKLDTQNYLMDRASLTGVGDVGEQAAIAAAVASYAYPSNIEILTCVCIVCGVVHITMSLMRLGVLSLMFSDQLISSFTTAGAVHVLTSQLPSLFDLNLAPIQSELFKCMRIWWQFIQALVYDGFNQTTGLLSLASIAFLLLIKELIEPRLRARFKRLTCLPSELILMVIVITCSSYFKFETNYQVKIVGQVPSGLPEPRVPRLELVPYVFKDAISIALITFAMNLSIAQVYAKKFRYELNANQELFALGSANIISSFFSCFPCASSLSRSSIQSNLNVKSQLCSLFSCCIVVTIICSFTYILHDLPKSTLSCIIVVALKGILMQLRDLYDNWRLSKLDALVWIFTFISVLVFGVTYGLILGIIASIFMIFLRLLTPHHSILARLPGTDIFVDKDAFAECEEIDQVKIFRFNSALCYLNRTRLKSMIEKLLPGVFPPTGFRAICAQLHAPSRAHPYYESTATTTNANEAGLARVSHLIIDCSALSYCDYSGAATLVELVEDLEARKVAVYLAACPLKLIDMLEKIQGQKEIVRRNVYPTISDALGQISYLRRVVVMPTTANFQEKRNSKSGPTSRSSDPIQQQDRSIVDGGGGGDSDVDQANEHQAVDKRPSILFVPNKGG